MQGTHSHYTLTHSHTHTQVVPLHHAHHTRNPSHTPHTTLSHILSPYHTHSVPRQRGTHTLTADEFIHSTNIVLYFLPPSSFIHPSIHPSSFIHPSFFPPSSFLLPSSFILPSSFLLPPSSFTPPPSSLLPSSFLLHPSSFIPPPSSFPSFFLRRGPCTADGFLALHSAGGGGYHYDGPVGGRDRHD